MINLILVLLSLLLVKDKVDDCYLTLRFSPKKQIEFANRQLNIVEVRDERSEKGAIKLLYRKGKKTTCLGLDKQLDVMIYDYIQKVLPSQSSRVPIIIKIEQIECYHQQGFFGISTRVFMDLEFSMLDDDDNEIKIYDSEVSRQLKKSVISGKTYGIIIQEILDEEIRIVNDKLIKRKPSH